MYWFQQRIQVVTEGVEHALKDVDLLARMLERIECETFASERMHELSSRIMCVRRMPSDCLARLHFLANLLETRRNYIVRLLDLPLMYSVQLAFALDHAKALGVEMIKVFRQDFEFRQQIELQRFRQGRNLRRA